jgi:hypothetical protein
MANKKIRFSKPTKSSSGLNFKVRFRYEGKSGGYFVVTNPKKKVMEGKQFNNHDDALVFAKSIDNAFKKK